MYLVFLESAGSSARHYKVQRSEVIV